MAIPINKNRWLDFSWFLFWGIASSIWCVTAATKLGPTLDEVFYFSEGLNGWKAGSCEGLLNKGTMPLPIDVETLPLHLWSKWTGRTIDSAVDIDSLLIWCRVTDLIVWWLLLFYVGQMGRLVG